MALNGDGYYRRIAALKAVESFVQAVDESIPSKLERPTETAHIVALRDELDQLLADHAQVSTNNSRRGGDCPACPGTMGLHGKPYQGGETCINDKREG